jgi:hypothetical protein
MPKNDRGFAPLSSSPGVRLLLQWKKAREPISLSINGKMTLSVEDEDSFDKLLGLVDQLDRHQAIREALQELEDGKGLTLEDALEQMRAGHGVSH